MTQREPSRVPTNGPDKSDAVRKYLNEHPDASVEEVIDGLQEQEIRVSEQIVRQTKDALESD